MELLDARRLTGPNLHFDVPAAVVDIGCDAMSADDIADAWELAVGLLHSALGEPPGQCSRIDLDGGLSLACTAAIDALYLASEINELAFAIAAAGITGVPPPAMEAELARLRTARDEERNPPLLSLAAAAGRQAVTLLWDDDDVSLGMGNSARTWPSRALPDAAAVAWATFRDVPVGLVTGTNGKTTTVRLAQHVLRCAGRNVGVSSTDWIAVNERIVDRGDWSGPGGARSVLRQAEVDTAVLEVARGGLLRRGLGVERADVALITNVSADHLGDFGSRNLDELLQIKWLVSRAVAAGGELVLNADDERLVAKAEGYDGRLTWFSLDPANPVVTRHRAGGGRAFVLSGDRLLYCEGDVETLLCRDHEIPITLGGHARHNTANALAASALCLALGASPAELGRGLGSISQDENPGRCNLYTLGKRTVLVDFAHNPNAMQALADMARALPAARRALCFGQAGDRPEALIRAMARVAWSIGLDRVYVSELADYYRGRGPGEVYDIIRSELLALGAAPDCIEHHEKETESFAAALDWAQPGDLVIMLALASRAPIMARLDELTQRTG